MKIKPIKLIAGSKIALIASVVLLMASCNKELPEATPKDNPDANPVATTLASVIGSDANYSFYKAAVNRIGALKMLDDANKKFTIFLPTNNAFIASGITSEAVVGALPLASIGAIVQYSMIPGEQYLAADIPTTFPNVQLPTSLTIGVLPGTTVPIKMTIFLSKRDNGAWANTIPIVKPDLKFKNGVIHEVAAIVAPPSQLLKDALYSNPELTYFKAAIARADSGSTGLSKLDSLLGYGLTNMTVLAPNDAAFQALIFGLAFKSYFTGKPGPFNAMDTAIAMATGNGAVAAGPIFLSTNNVSTAQIKGIMAYHLLATNQGLGYQPNIRAFSNNFATTPGVFYTTLVNTSVPPSMQPGVMAMATFTGPFVSTLTFAGAGTFPPGGAPYSQAATAVSKDKLAVNGVYHVIDKVLLPQ